MSDSGALLAEMTERLFADLFGDPPMRASREGQWPAAAWAAVEDHGLPLALVEGEQGFGLSMEDGLAVIRLLGRRAVPLPLGETMIGQALLGRANLPLPTGPLALIPSGSGIALRRHGSAWRASGEADRVAWGGAARAILIEDGDHVALMTSGFDVAGHGSNLANMPRDRLLVDGNADIAPRPAISLLEAGALVRALAMAGALETLVELSIAHVSERRQFGRNLSAFQAVQHALAQLAAEAAAAAAAAALAASAFARSSPQAGVAIAAARSRIGEAAGTAIGIAHQLHGAIGFTQEHRLHWFTTALWSWRDEFGSTGWWTRRLGAVALANSKSAYWPFITSL